MSRHYMNGDIHNQTSINHIHHHVEISVSGGKRKKNTIAIVKINKNNAVRSVIKLIHNIEDLDTAFEMGNELLKSDDYIAKYDELKLKVEIAEHELSEAEVAFLVRLRGGDELILRKESFGLVDLSYLVWSVGAEQVDMDAFRSLHYKQYQLTVKR